MKVNSSGLLLKIEGLSLRLNLSVKVSLDCLIMNVFYIYVNKGGTVYILKYASLVMFVKIR